MKLIQPFVVAVTLLMSLLVVSSAARADGLNRHAEYHITSNDLVTFSRSAARVRLCPECDVVNLTVDSDTGFYEYKAPIDLSRATELYLRKNVPVIFVGVDRQNSTVDYINFGGHAPGVPY